MESKHIDQIPGHPPRNRDRYTLPPAFKPASADHHSHNPRHFHSSYRSSRVAADEVFAVDARVRRRESEDGLSMRVNLVEVASGDSEAEGEAEAEEGIVTTVDKKWGVGKYALRRDFETLTKQNDHEASKEKAPNLKRRISSACDWILRRRQDSAGYTPLLDQPNTTEAERTSEPEEHQSMTRCVTADYAAVAGVSMDDHGRLML